MTGFALPRPSVRFVPIYRRNLLVWRKLALPSVMANVAEPLITLIAFGYGLGRLLPEIGGVPYITFLVGGALCMSTAMSASFESLYSAFSRMHVQRTWDALLNAPLELDDVVAAECAWAATKGLLAGAAIAIVALAIGAVREPMLLLALPVVALTGFVFAAIGLCFNALARSYEFFAYYFTLVLTPMIFLSGVYYPMTVLPDWLAAPARWLPMSAAVELARPLVLGRWPEAPLRALLLLGAYALVGYYLALVLTRRRFSN
ncbi:MAG: ABC transporter permease [Burkholderiales bacterium]|nr:MAG: ABC transporter permease [Burkholderiales bacterium]